MPWHPALIVLFLTGLIAAGHISTNIYTPSLPAMTDYFDTDPAKVWMTISVYLLGFAFAQLVYGPLSDRFGRRRVLLYGLVLYLVATAVSTVSVSIEMLIVARAFQSFGACAGPVIGRAIVRDLFGREEAAKVMAYIGMTMGIAPVFAPVLGGYLEEWYGWQASFAVVTLFAAFMLWLSWARLPETNKYLETNAEWGSLGLASYARLLRSREYLGFVISGSLVYGGMFAFNVGSPFVVIQILGRTPSEFGLLSVMPIAGWLIGSFVTSRIAERIGINRLLPIGIAILFISGLAFAVLALAGDPSIFSLYTPMTIMAFGMALVFPSTLAGAVSVYPEIAGTASALYGFLQMVASFAGIQLLGFFEDGTDMPMVWVTTGAMTMATVVFLMLVQRGRRERSVAR